MKKDPRVEFLLSHPTAMQRALSGTDFVLSREHLLLITTQPAILSIIWVGTVPCSHSSLERAHATFAGETKRVFLCRLLCQPNGIFICFICIPGISGASAFSLLCMEASELGFPPASFLGLYRLLYVHIARY